MAPVGIIAAGRGGDQLKNTAIPPDYRHVLVLTHSLRSIVPTPTTERPDARKATGHTNKTKVATTCRRLISARPGPTRSFSRRAPHDGAVQSALYSAIHPCRVDPTVQGLPASAVQKPLRAAAHRVEGAAHRRRHHRQRRWGRCRPRHRIRLHGLRRDPGLLVGP